MIISLAMFLAFRLLIPDATGYSWPLTYEGASSDRIRSDGRFERLLNTRVPAGLSEELLRALSGPPDPVLVSNRRYVSISACVQHACGTKGFFWIDTATGVGLGAVARHWPMSAPDSVALGSNGVSARHIPVEARNALVDWLTENGIRAEDVRFVGSRGDWLSLDASAFTPKPTWEPRPSGPGFECANAAGVVENTICEDVELSLLDLSVFNLVEDIRRSDRAIAARTRLVEAQAAWKRQRDAQCAVASDVKACLESMYEAQIEKLWRQIPK